MPPNTPPGPPVPPTPGMPQSYPLMPNPGQQRKKSHFNWFIVPTVVFTILFLATAGYAVSINTEKNDFKNNVQEKVDAAVEANSQKVADEKEKEFLEREKNPYREYKGPSQFGTVTILYPKTWSAQVTETSTGNSPVDGYMHPSFVPGPNSKTAFALRVQVVERAYNAMLGSYESATKQNKVRVSPFTAAKVPSVLGARVDGEIDNGLQGSMVLFPLRDKTIVISTQSKSFVPDFDNIILPNLVFSP